jgi:putative acetyltransferase
MIEIRRIKPDEWTAAKRVVYCVAQTVFKDPRPLEEAMEDYKARHPLKDMDDIQQNYFEKSGTFLVITEKNKIIGTGAIRHVSEGVCELKRLWLLQEYQGKGLGYRMTQELFTFARNQGYRRIVLETDPVIQKRAYDLYKRVGFRDLHPNPDHPEDMVMEMDL